MVTTTAQRKEHADAQRRFTTRIHRELVIRLLGGEVLTVGEVRDTVPVPSGVIVDQGAAADFPSALMRIGAVKRAGSVEVRGDDGRCRQAPLWGLGSREAAEKFFRSVDA